jgi:hypothetical protein
LVRLVEAPLLATLRLVAPSSPTFTMDKFGSAGGRLLGKCKRALA